MSVVRWSRTDLAARVGELALDELLEADALVLDGISAADDPGLEWCRRAPCVVIARSDPDDAPTNVDLAVAPAHDTRLDEILANVDANPAASRTLVDVLRVTSVVDVAAGLVVESLAYSMLLAGPEFSRWLVHQPGRERKVLDRPPVRIERRGGAVDIVLDRAENRNAFSAELRDALHAALVAVSVDDSVATIDLRAEGPVFSSGGDLAEFGTTPDVVAAHGIRSSRSVGAAIARDAARITAHVRGACVGAGVELSAFAGRVVADADTSFRLPEVSMGLIPGAGGTVSVTRRIGTQRAAELALSGRAMPAGEALEVGLVDELT